MDNIQLKTNLPLSAIGALALGQKIQAIKIVRAETALDLKTAKELVEAYEREHPDIRPAPLVDRNAADSPWLWVSVLFLVIGSAGWFFLSNT
jgi:predicted DNA-binding protein (MmcQ/YjbR family)